MNKDELTQAPDLVTDMQFAAGNILRDWAGGLLTTENALILALVWVKAERRLRQLMEEANAEET